MAHAQALGRLAALVSVVAGLLHLFYLARLANYLDKSGAVWALLAVVFASLGIFVAYFMIRGAADKAITAVKSPLDAGSKQ